ncbi:MAG TPA: hypothetical protein DEB24_02770, partial [Coriobacteriia bacterium]|nr:hypothetical protein [Coriobacteriia bacterium]
MPFDRKKNGRHFKASESTSVHSTENELQGSDGYKPLESKTATYKAPRTKPPAIKAPVSEKVASDPVSERASTSKQGFAAPEGAKFVADTIAGQDHSADRQASKNKVPKNTVEVSSVNVSGLKEAGVFSSSAK